MNEALFIASKAADKGASVLAVAAVVYVALQVVKLVLSHRAGTVTAERLAELVESINREQRETAGVLGRMARSLETIDDRLAVLIADRVVERHERRRHGDGDNDAGPRIAAAR